MTQEVRTYYADSVHATRTPGGLLSIPVDGIEVPAEGLCAYIDDVTLAGQLSAVSAQVENAVDALVGVERVPNGGRVVTAVHRLEVGGSPIEVAAW